MLMLYRGSYCGALCGVLQALRQDDYGEGVLEFVERLKPLVQEVDTLALCVQSSFLLRWATLWMSPRSLRAGSEAKAPENQINLIDSRDVWGRTPLLRYVIFGDQQDCIERCRGFLNNGANIHAVDCMGHSVLHFAVTRSSRSGFGVPPSKNLAELLSFLIEAGAGVHCRSNFGRTPSTIARCLGVYEEWCMALKVNGLEIEEVERIDADGATKKPTGTNDLNGSDSFKSGLGRSDWREAIRTGAVRREAIWRAATWERAMHSAEAIDELHELIAYRS